MSHPPFAHNPHVYDGVDPDAPSVVVGRRELPLVGEHGPELVDPAQLAALAEANPVEDNTPDPVGGDTPPSDEDANVDVNGDGRIDGYELFTKVELVAECERRGLSTAGNKPDLVARLQEADKPAEGA